MTGEGDIIVKVSIIVAAYNVEKYIERCLDSIMNQTYKNIEIIIVNDCSTDSTPIICAELCKKDHRVTIINKVHNEGLSEARNTGMSNAVGDYVTFIDGDDFIELDTIEACVKAIDTTKADEIVFGSSFDRKNGQSYIMQMKHSLDFYQGNNMKDYINEAIGSLPSDINDRNIGITPWGRVYKKSILDKHGLKFISERIYIYEDLTFFLLSTPYINSVSILDKPFYHYCENEGSLTQKADLTRFNKVKKMYEYIIKNYGDSLLVESETSLRFKRLMLSYIRLSIMQIGKNTNDISLIRKICKDDFTKEILNHYPIFKLPFKQRVFTILLKCEFSFLLLGICRIYK